jgi:hypothetical protein
LDEDLSLCNQIVKLANPASSFVLLQSKVEEFKGVKVVIRDGLGDFDSQIARAASIAIVHEER